MPSPAPSSATRLPRTSSGSERSKPARLAAAGHTLDADLAIAVTPLYGDADIFVNAGPASAPRWPPDGFDSGFGGFNSPFAGSYSTPNGFNTPFTGWNTPFQGTTPNGFNDEEGTQPGGNSFYSGAYGFGDTPNKTNAA